MKLRKIPHDGKRIETGPTQIGDDWPGVFIRGDDAFGMLMSLDSPIQFQKENASTRLRDLLDSCHIRHHREDQDE